MEEIFPKNHTPTIVELFVESKDLPDPETFEGVPCPGFSRDLIVHFGGRRSYKWVYTGPVSL